MGSTLAHLCVALALASALKGAVFADIIRGRVVGIQDGDTVTVLDAERSQHRIRLAGIDAPEKAQAFGARSKENLSALVYGREVAVEWGKRDRYGRVIGKIYVAGQDINLHQIKAGLAWHYKAYAREQTPDDRDLYEAAEARAIWEQVGLWSEPTPIPPWDFRRLKRERSVPR